MSAAAPSHTLLSALALHEPATVLSVAPPSHAPEWADWLAQIGFLPGERVSLTARARPGGDPLVVRVGDSTFALRRAEAACVQVRALAAADGEGMAR
jgi:ferrous iron transport protein A